MNKEGSTASRPTGAEVGNRLPDSHEEVVLRGGERVVIRPLREGEIELERQFIESLSAETRRYRFLETISTPSDSLLERLTVLDPATDVAFVAVTGDGRHERAVGVGRFSADAGGLDCEFALTVTDAWQEKGLGSHLMRSLMAVASARGITRMHSSDAADNVMMRKFAVHFRLQHETDPDDARLVLYSVDLPHDPPRFIQMTQTDEVSDWCESLGCSESELKAAVATVGNAAERVREYLTGRRHSPR